jgi:21S rRNA (uridine2791-2'-O)-methyltransferase
VQGLKSRAAFKLLELDSKYHLFRRGKGQVVVDLGYAPGSWSQVALDRTAPNGTVVGIDIIPAQPPKGVSTIQGNFLSPGVQAMVKQFLLEGEKKRRAERASRRVLKGEGVTGEGEEGGDEVADRPSYIDLERMAAHESDAESGVSSSSAPTPDESTHGEEKKPNLRLVDVRPRPPPRPPHSP